MSDTMSLDIYCEDLSCRGETSLLLLFLVRHGLFPVPN